MIKTCVIGNTIIVSECEYERMLKDSHNLNNLNSICDLDENVRNNTIEVIKPSSDQFSYLLDTYCVVKNRKINSLLK